MTKVTKSVGCNMADGGCGALPGEGCISKTGGPTGIHKARKDAYALMQHKNEVSAEQKIETALAKTVESLGYPAEGMEQAVERVLGADWDEPAKRLMRKETRINQILWGINFARVTMGTPQEQIDRNLAELLYEAEISDGMMP
jgi:hypothetical protein